MKIFIIVGMPASGKNIARIYAEKKNIPYFATGDLVREEVKRGGLVPNPENMGRVSDELRGKDGMGVTRLALQTAQESGATLVFMEGMRSWPEMDGRAGPTRVGDRGLRGKLDLRRARCLEVAGTRRYSIMDRVVRALVCSASR